MYLGSVNGRIPTLGRLQLAKPPMFDLSGIQGSNPLRDVKGKGKVKVESRVDVEADDAGAY